MTGSLMERYDDRIAGVLSCYDRVVVTGTLPTVCEDANPDRVEKLRHSRGVATFECHDIALLVNATEYV
jgi:hypothetical protein